MTDDSTGAVGREGLVAGVFSALGAGLGGALVIGETGIGKSAVVAEVLARMADDVHVEHIRGSALAAKVPYAALGLLLTDADPRAMNHPALVLEALAASLLKRSQGRRIVIFVENADGLDPLAGIVLAQLVWNGSISLLATAEDAGACDGAFLGLWTEGQLLRFDVGPVDLDCTGQMLEKLVGGPLSAYAVQSLWKVAGGHPLYLRVIARELLRSGHLVRSGDVWVLVGPMVIAGEIIDIMQLRLQRMAPDERRIAEIVSLARALPLRVLAAVAGTEQVDRLEERGILEICTGQDPLVRIHHPFMAEAIAGSVPPGRSRELWQEVLAQLTAADVSTAELPGLVAWTLDCGGRVSSEDLVRAAQVANADDDPATALRIIRTVSAKDRSASVQLVELRAALLAGNAEAAQDSLLIGQQVNVQDPTDADIRLAVERNLARRTADGNVPSDGRDLKLARKGALSLPYPPTVDPARSMMELAEDLTLAEAEQAIFEGRYSDVSDDVFRLYTDRGRKPDVRVAAGGMLCEAWSVCGRQAEAVELASTVVDCVKSLRPSNLVKDAALVRIVNALLVSGLLDSCLELLDSPEIRSLGSVRMAEAGQVARGVAHVLAGRPDAALQSLVPAAAQLEIRDCQSSLPLVHAAAAYAYALADDGAKSRLELGLADRPGPHASHGSARFEALFRLQALAALQPGNDLPAAFLREAEADRTAGNFSHALIFLAAATRLSGEDAADAMWEVSRKIDGPFAVLCDKYGSGLVNGHVPELIEAAELSMNLGNSFLAYEVARTGHLLASQSADRSAARLAQNLENMNYRQLRPLHSLTEQISSLTPFEADLVARVAAGDSSGSIGRTISLSPRTVDWHLGRIFEKLHVAGRAELRESLDNSLTVRS